MDKQHYNELVTLSQELYDQATDKLTNYFASKYCGISNSTTEDQLEDYLFVTEEISAYLLGNALALLSPDSQETEIKTFTGNIRRIAAYAQKKMGNEQKAN